MDTDEKEASKEGGGAADMEAMADDDKDGKEEKAPAAPEPGSCKLDNPSRVTPGQQKFVAFEEGSRWRPIHAARPVSGIIVLKDLRPGPAPLGPV